MKSFLWISGHMGWGVFTIVVFTGLWLLLWDLIWRMRNSRIHRLTVEMSIGWIIGAALILLGFYLSNS